MDKKKINPIDFWKKFSKEDNRISFYFKTILDSVKYYVRVVFSNFC